MFMLPLGSYLETDKSFYQTIIDNNIFRPLGWRLKTPPFPYHLIGTVIYRSKNKNSIAVVQQTNGQRETHTVSIGDKLGDITVIDIQSKKVILDKAGKKITLRITQQYLNIPRSIPVPTQMSHTKDKTEHVVPPPIEVASPHIDADTDEDTEYTYEFRDDY